MLILTLRTDKPEAEIGLFENEQQLAYETWQAHRQLAETLHLKIAKKLQFVDKDWQDIEGIVVFEGPGSFTGLRIGISLANALVLGQNIPIIAGNGAYWQSNGIKRLLKGENDNLALPEYGAAVNVTLPKK
jgi:tRNA threonylcarbamoyladenosine biosynthesis protein TsaB